MPLIIGALAVGMVTVFKLQSGVSNRLGDTSDSQVVSSVFSKDVTTAQYATTDPTSSPRCGSTGTQILGLEGNYDSTTGFFGFTISYVIVPQSASTEILERFVCQGEGAYRNAPTSTTVLAQDYSSSSALPTIFCASSATTCSAALALTTWIPTQQVQDITMPVTEQTTGYQYTVAGSPVNNITTTQQGVPVTASGTTTCNAPNANTGALSSNLCLIDFSALSPQSTNYSPALWSEATTAGDCAEMSAAVGLGDTLYFCLNIKLVNPSGDDIFRPTSIPNYVHAFFGNCFPNPNDVNGVPPTGQPACYPFYTGIAGDAALWLNADVKCGANVCDAANTQASATLTFSNIELVNSTGQAASGWKFISADAESTDDNPETISWYSPLTTADIQQGVPALTPLCNGEPWDYCPSAVGQAVVGTDQYHNYDYWGNACLDDQPTVGLTTATVTYSGVSQTEIQCLANLTSPSEYECEPSSNGCNKSGTGIVEASAPSTLTVVETTENGGLQAVAVGLLVPGVPST